jgi:hypothetical protein
LDHGVGVAGYDAENVLAYWLIRNSWEKMDILEWLEIGEINVMK